MADETIVTLKLNQQQLELLDRTIARGIAPDRAALVRLALREYAAAHVVARLSQFEGIEHDKERAKEM